MKNESLNRLFNPTSIAVIGASTNPEKAGHQMVRALANFAGELFPVNPEAREILGFTSFPNMKAIGKPVDLAILTLPAKICAQAAEEAIASGVGALMIISGGFGESGEQGRVLQAKIVSMCQQHGVKLLGPNTSGFALPRENLAVSFAPGMDNLKPGPVGIIAQSGAINLTLSALATAQEIGISLAVGIGNGEDVSSADVIEYLTTDENTQVIGVYLEGVSNGRRLYNAIQKATKTKPVVVFTVGRADVGEFAASHTGNLIGSFSLKASALKQAGAVVVSSTHDLIDAVGMFSHIRLAANPDPGVALLTGQAGPGMIISDHLRWRNIRMPQLSAETIDRIGQLLPPLTFIKNPVDTGRPGKTFGDVLKAVAADPAIDAIVTFALHEPSAIDPVSIFETTKESLEQPLIFGTAGVPEYVTPTCRSLEALDIPAFPSPDRAAKAAWALAEDAKARYRNQESHQTTVDDFGDRGPITRTVNEAEAKDILGNIGVTTPQRYIANNWQEALAGFSALPKPCVVKVLSSEILHKTEVGGVHIGINAESDLRAAITAIDSIPTSGPKGYLIETMAPPGLEIIIGATNNSSFGPTVLVGMGGTAAEALNDVAIRLAPLNPVEALEMIDELKCVELLNGWRGAEKLDKDAISRALVRVGQFVALHPEVNELELNPVRVYPQGIIALDALIVV